MALHVFTTTAETVSFIAVTTGILATVAFTVSTFAAVHAVVVAAAVVGIVEITFVVALV